MFKQITPRKKRIYIDERIILIGMSVLLVLAVIALKTETDRQYADDTSSYSPLK